MTTYDYISPSVGGPHGSPVLCPIPEGTTRVAFAHTHPNSNDFSPKDKSVADEFGIDAYVVGPNYELQRYTHASSITVSLGEVSITKVSDAMKELLTKKYEPIWKKHIEEGCDFNCKKIKWPSY